jgi:nucleoside-diphosphate-sugar epimerase
MRVNFTSDDVALVTGASGFTGKALVRSLCAQGVTVRAIARPSSKLDSLADLPVTWLRGQIFDADLAQKAVQGVSYIFHVAAAYREAKITEQTYHDVHVKSTMNLVQAASVVGRLKRFVHVSTVGVHGHIDNPPANEEYRFAPGDTYQRTKTEAELWLREHAPTLRVPFCVMRPAAIMGPEDRRLLKVFKMATKPIFPILGFGKCLYHLIHVEDLVHALIEGALNPAAEGQVFIVGNDEAIALTDFVSLIGQELGTSPRVIRLPVTPFFVAAAACELLCKPFGIEPPLYRRRVAFFTKDRSFDTSKIRSVLGFSTKFSNASGIAQTARWYRENGWL